jgi:predicted secreted protein
VADDIEIRIGATTDALDEAVDHAKEKIATLAAAARLAEGTVASLADGMNHMAADAGNAAKGALAAASGGGAAAGASALSSRIAELQSYIRLTDLAYAGEVEHLNAAARIGSITEAQKTQALREALNDRFAQEQNYYQKEIEAAGANAARRQRIEAQFNIAYQRYLNERQRLDDQALQASVRDWQAALSPIQSAWDSQLKGLLSGTTNFAAALRAVVQNLVLEIIKEFEKAALAKAALGLASAGLDLGTGGIGGALFAGLGKLVGLDVGAWSVPGDMPAMVHAGEMIIPAGAAEQFRSVLSGAGTAGAAPGGAAGASSVTFQVQAMDSASVAQFFRSNAAQLARTISAHLNSNPSARPGY